MAIGMMMAKTTTNRLSNAVEELGRCNALLRLLTDDLAELLEEPAERATTRWVLGVLEAMLDNLQQQIRHEEEHDYLAEVLEQYPSWHPQVEHLRQQQQLLHRQLREIRERIAAGADDAAVLFEARRQLRDWIEAYNEHQRRETRLIQDAFTLETGVGE